MTSATLLAALAQRHQGHLFVAECKLGSSYIGTKSGAACLKYIAFWRILQQKPITV